MGIRFHFRPAAPPGATAHSASRRRFLAGLGVLAGAGVLAPLLGRTPPARARSLEAGRPALGTWMRVVVRDAAPDRARRGIEAAFAEVRRVDRLMSVHRADSDLSRVNAAAGRGPAPVDADVRHVIAAAVDVARRSQGAYDAALLPLMHLYGFYGMRRDRPPTDREIGRALDATGSRHVVADPAAGTVGLARAGAGLDLGSIGKGWAVDRAVAALRAAGIERGLVDLGGNVHGLGVPEDGADGWAVGITHPESGRLERVLTLRDASAATSGNGEQLRRLGALRFGHLFDPRTGRPAAGHLAVTVVAARGIDADALSTVAFVLGPDRLADWPEAIDVHGVG